MTIILDSSLQWPNLLRGAQVIATSSLIKSADPWVNRDSALSVLSDDSADGVLDEVSVAER